MDSDGERILKNLEVMAMVMGGEATLDGVTIFATLGAGGKYWPPFTYETDEEIPRAEAVERLMASSGGHR